MSVLKLSMEERQSRVTITSEPFLSTSFTHLSFHLKKKYTFNLHNSSFIIKMRIWICFDIWMLVYCYSVEFSPIRKHQRVLTNSSRKKKKIEIIPPWPYNSIHSYLTHESFNTYYLCQLQLIRKDRCTSWSFNTQDLSLIRVLVLNIKSEYLGHNFPQYHRASKSYRPQPKRDQENNSTVPGMN